MVAVLTLTDHASQVVLTPNQSLSWQGNMWVIVVFSMATILFALPIALLGGWVVIPFAVLQILALTYGLYSTFKKLNHREVITLQDGQLFLHRGSNKVDASWVFSTSSVKILIEEQDHPVTPPDINLVAEGHCYNLGVFLNKADRLELADTLKNHLNLRITNLGSFHRYNF
ncbi:MAG: putative membrane protein [Porticoccus sp.]|jgi:uncharacterized membrane protein